jgi:hypothetical protein
VIELLYTLRSSREGLSLRDEKVSSITISHLNYIPQLTEGGNIFC